MKNDDGGEDPLPFETTLPDVNLLQALLDNKLAVRSNGILDEDAPSTEDVCTFKPSWTKYDIDSWLSITFPQVWLWLMENRKLDDDDENHGYWVLLSRINRRLVEFVKKGPVSGRDLEMIKSPKGKKWTEQKLYFGAYPDTLRKHGSDATS